MWSCLALLWCIVTALEFTKFRLRLSNLSTLISMAGCDALLQDWTAPKSFPWAILFCETLSEAPVFNIFFVPSETVRTDVYLNFDTNFVIGRFLWFLFKNDVGKISASRHCFIFTFRADKGKANKPQRTPLNTSPTNNMETAEPTLVDLT